MDILAYNQSDINKYLDKYKLESNVGVIQRKLVEGCLMQSRGTDLITTQDQTVGLVYVLVFKINHRQEIVRYQLCYFFLILVVVFYFEI